MIFNIDVFIMNQQSSYVVPTYPQLQNKNPQIPQEGMIPNKQNMNPENTKNLLFYSHNCPHSLSILNDLNKANKINEIELICVDNRHIKDNITYITLPGNQHMPLPPMINSVPTLCILPNHEIFKGAQIKHYLLPIAKTLEQEKQAINHEPNAFALGSETNGTFGVSSDNFSFWDSTHEEMSASGNAGLKQMYSYATVDSQANESIYTPQDNSKEKKQNISLEQLQQQRQNEL